MPAVSLAAPFDPDARLDPQGLVATELARHLTAYVDPETLRGGRVLDFGCGIGSSSFHLARLLPQTEIVGVELNAVQVAIGNRLRLERGVTNVRFVASPSETALPSQLGAFDAIALGAVYEHLRPIERRTLLPRLWALLKPGGVLLVTGTPYRWFPIEHHTTGLPFLNYLPNGLTLWLAQRFGKDPGHGDWATYLRHGIRGGTEWSVQRDLLGAGVLLQPRTMDRADYWLTGTSPRHRGLKRVLASIFRVTDRVLGTIPSTHVDIAIRKP